MSLQFVEPFAPATLSVTSVLSRRLVNCLAVVHSSVDEHCERRECYGNAVVLPDAEARRNTHTILAQCVCCLVEGGSYCSLQKNTKVHKIAL